MSADVFTPCPIIYDVITYLCVYSDGTRLKSTLLAVIPVARCVLFLSRSVVNELSTHSYSPCYTVRDYCVNLDTILVFNSVTSTPLTDFICFTYYLYF